MHRPVIHSSDHGAMSLFEGRVQALLLSLDSSFSDTCCLPSYRGVL